MPLPVFTIGHSTRTIPEFVDLLRQGSVELVVDIRTIPRSRRNPQYNEDVLGAELEPYQLGYVRIAELGGLRGRSPEVPAEVNAFWENRSFHNYADYALSERYADGLEELLALSAERRCAIMCAEAVWWRCHRRIVADYLLACGRTVCHLLGTDRVEPARLTQGAVPAGGRISYPAAAPDGSSKLESP
jgi:uncharacterized protein (DUF488 family)